MVRRLLLFISLLIAAPLAAETPIDEFDVTLELVLDERNGAPLEGEMVLATLRGAYREVITNEEIKLRRMTDFDWIQLAPDRWTEQVVDGLPTVVLERRIGLASGPRHRILGDMEHQPQKPRRRPTCRAPRGAPRARGHSRTPARTTGHA